MGIFSRHKNSLAAEIAAKTPSTRDRYVDFLRAFSISAVVVGHWLSSVIIYGGSGIRTFNAVGVLPGLWVATWVFQVMPLFFFVGGFSNLVTNDSFRRRGESNTNFVRVRTVRLLKPAGIFLIIWIAILILVALVFAEGMELARALSLVITPLWFLAVYLMVIVVTPVMIALHRSLHVWVLVALSVLAVTVDILRFTIGVPYVSWANVAFVWLFVHQLGFFYADGSLARAPKRVHVAMAFGGLLALIVLTNIGVYPRSMVGTGTEEISNMNPPTLCIPMLALWLIGAAMLLRSAVNKWLMRNTPWLVIVKANSVIVTVYLWHLTAFVIVFLIFLPLGFVKESVGTHMWWLQRPIWIIGSAVILLFLVKIFARFESLAREKNPLSKEES
jgi:fucose 4-O-acetylase-like acetyltransferase